MSRLAMPLVFHRRFQLWSYSVGHSVLLLRSNMDGGQESRIDLMFRSVTAVKLRCRYERLLINITRPDQLGDSPADLREITDRFIFVIGEDAEDLGYVVAGALFYSEDDLDYGEPSAIDHRELQSHVIASGHFR